MLCKWENLQNRQCIKYLFSPLYVQYVYLSFRRSVSLCTVCMYMYIIYISPSWGRIIGLIIDLMLPGPIPPRSRFRGRLNVLLLLLLLLKLIIDRLLWKPNKHHIPTDWPTCEMILWRNCCFSLKTSMRLLLFIASMTSIPTVCTTVCTTCKSLWIKASAKWITCNL